MDKVCGLIQLNAEGWSSIQLSLFLYITYNHSK